MSNPPPYSQVRFTPIADPAAVIQIENARFTVLTSRLLRLEYSPSGQFEDRPSQAFWYRHQVVPEFEVVNTPDGVTITTQFLQLDYRPDPPGFTSHNLSVKLLPDDPLWRFDQPDTGNLLGTTRTLDTVSGSTRLDPGLLSRDGWVAVDDSTSLVFDPSGWLVPRGSSGGTKDIYFFGYGHAYRDCLRDYCRLAGSASLLPRWALGNWWSRYWAYSDEDLRRLMTDFREHEVPLSVCIVDMDWHLVNVGEGISGWTGYTWNNDLFPDPAGFIAWLHDQGLRTALNLHPALGIRPHEAMYGEMADRLGKDPATKATLPFDIADPDFTAAYFEILHHPQEAIGVDFWWMDWQQGTQSKVHGLDPLWWLNHLHYYDLGRQAKRPFVFSRWGGLGNHRYPIGFSGDTIVAWDSLAFQPYFTATAANVAYGWWSHDIGGHMRGVEEPELFARWVQFGVFSPIFRLHCTSNPFHERRPWAYSAEVFQVTREAMQLRHALIPYLYTMSRLDEVQNQALVRPMYHDYPEYPEAYACPQQYLFGTELIAAPYTSPCDPDTRLSRQVFWLPPGDWFHLFTGEYLRGDNWYARYGSMEDIPVFARAGGIVPLGPRTGWGGVENPSELHVTVFAGADGRFTLYEDDGISKDYQQGAFALTTITQRWEPGSDATSLKLTLSPVSGDIAILPEARSYSFDVVGIARPSQVIIRIDGNIRRVDFHYDDKLEILRLSEIAVDKTASLQIVITMDGVDPLARRDRTRETIEAMLSRFRMNTHAKALLVVGAAQLMTDPLFLADYRLELTDTQLKALIEVTQGVGSHYIPNIHHPHQLILWNNRETDIYRRHFTKMDEGRWVVSERYYSTAGVVPKFEAHALRDNHWQLVVDFAGLLTERYDPGRSRID